MLAALMATVLDDLVLSIHPYKGGCNLHAYCASFGLFLPLMDLFQELTTF